VRRGDRGRLAAAELAERLVTLATWLSCEPSCSQRLRRFRVDLQVDLLRKTGPSAAPGCRSALLPITESTETSISSPIMMLWLDLRVRTSMWLHLPVCRALHGASELADAASIVAASVESDTQLRSMFPVTARFLQLWRS